MDNKQIIETNVVKPSLVIFNKEIEYRILDTNSEFLLDSNIKEIEDYMNNNHGSGKEDSYKDELYKNAKEMWEKYAENLRDTKYMFYLNKKQYQFLTDLLIDKMDYDVNTVFLAIELTNMLGEWRTVGTKKDDDHIEGYVSDATQITYIYHLISKHKVKGLSHASYRFVEVLKKIGHISKIVAYYDASAKSLAKDIQDWVASFEPNVTIEGKDWGKENKEETVA
jgi:hypothetical protein